MEYCDVASNVVEGVPTGAVSVLQWNFASDLSGFTENQRNSVYLVPGKRRTK